MTAFRSQLYLAKVHHRRLRPKAHMLSYRVGMLLVDLDELPELDRDLTLFSHNRRNLFSFYNSDFGPGDGRPLRGYVDQLLSKVGLADQVAQVTLLCYPRIAGYIFNPIVVYFCNNDTGEPVCLIYEVTNTFRERHSYVIPVEKKRNGVIHQACDKALYVSPFNQPSAHYQFRIKPPDEALTFSIRQYDSEGPVLDAALLGERRGLTNKSLAGLFLRFPFLTAKVMVAIHWEAAKLWFKGMRVFRHSKAPTFAFSVISNQKVQGRPPVAAEKRPRENRA